MSASTPQETMSTFERLLPSIRAKHGKTWAVVADDDFQGAFQTYREATEFAVSHFSPGAFLVKHTDAPMPYIPFVVVEEQVAGYTYGPDGASALDRSGELAAVGPVVEIRIRAPSAPLRAFDWNPAIHRESVLARGLIDTGASDVCIDARLAAELGLAETGREPVGVAGGVSVFSTVYAGVLEVPELGFSELMPLYTLKMRHPTHDVLLGRSFLKNFIVTFNGPEGMFHFYKPTIYEYPDHDG